MSLRDICICAVAALAVGCAGTSSEPPTTPDPITLEMVDMTAPDSFVAVFETSEGDFEVTFLREWSPAGVDRAYGLLANDFYAGARIYRMEPGFVAQFGFSGRPALDSLFREAYLPVEPVVASNTRGTISFARATTGTRSTQLFINLADNTRLDQGRMPGAVGYPPIGRLDEEGLQVTYGFYFAYRSDPPRQDSIARFGNDYLRRHYPQLDSIVSTRIVREWGGGEGG